MNEGGTPASPAEQQRAGNCPMGKGKDHIPQWVWRGDVWTNKFRCTTCGQVWESEKPCPAA